MFPAPEQSSDALKHLGSAAETAELRLEHEEAIKFCFIWTKSAIYRCLEAQWEEQNGRITVPDVRL
jgi:hypothetical protein